MKRRVFFIFMILMMMLGLAGCQSMHNPFQIEATLQEGESLHVLLPLGSPMDTDASVDTSTELAQYCEDGFYAAELWGNGSMEGTDFHFDRSGYNYGKLKEFIQQYREMRVAVTDAAGHIVQVSPTFPMVVEGSNSLWVAARYDRETNELRGTERRTIDDTLFMQMLLWGCIAGLCGIVMTAVSTWLFTTKRAWKTAFPLVFLVCYIPFGIFCVLQYRQYYLPYYAWDSDGLPHFGIVYDAMWILIALVAWGIWIVKLRKAEHPTESSNT